MDHAKTSRFQTCMCAVKVSRTEDASCGGRASGRLCFAGLHRSLAINYPDLHCPSRQKLCHLSDAAATGSGDTIVSNIDSISTQWGDPFFIESSAVLLECLLS